MKTVDYLMIGAGLAGHNAAVAARKSNSAGSILLVGSEPHRPYDRPPLTKEFMQGKTPAEKTYLQPAEFYADNRIELLPATRVTKLCPQDQTAELADGQAVKFGKALLATGGRPILPDLPGASLPTVLRLRTLDDAQAISNLAKPGARVAIVGGGFIGLELAASLTQRDVRATVIDSGPHIWSRFADETLARFVQDYCQQRGVMFCTGERAAAFANGDGATQVVTASGRSVACDFAVVAAGIAPNVELAQQAGLAVDNGVVVNEQLQTSHPAIYAAGDLCNYPDPLFGRRRVEHWGQADYTGTLAGENMAGANRAYGLLTYVFSDLFDLHLEFADDERACDRTILRGRLEEKSFSLLHLQGSVLRAHFSVNLKRKQFGPLNRLIESRTDLAGKEAPLADPAFDLATLLPPK